MVDILVRVGAYVSDVIGRRFEKLRNGHRFEVQKKCTDVCDLEIGHGFDVN